jgi:hypothetical protein
MYMTARKTQRHENPVIEKLSCLFLSKIIVIYRTFQYILLVQWVVIAVGPGGKEFLNGHFGRPGPLGHVRHPLDIIGTSGLAF